VLDAQADDLRGTITTVSGVVAAVEEFTSGRRIWDRRRVASQQSVVVAGTLDAKDRARARALNLRLDPLSLQQMVVYAADRATEEPKERTNA
jgi:ABC-2 type transport system ATP-binding protein